MDLWSKSAQHCDMRPKLITLQMMSPTAPLKNRQLIWHLYSAQAYGIFHGDLGKCRLSWSDLKASG